ncbi:MAG: hypothetical protein P8Y93_11990 [Acidobacteriota bacterium]
MGARHGFEREGDVAGRLEAVRLAFLEAPAHHLLQGRGDVGPEVRQRLGIRLQDCRHAVGRGLPAEGLAFRDHLVDHAAEREDVSLRVHLGAPHLLRRHVAQGAHDRAGLGQGVGDLGGVPGVGGGLAQMGNAEVEQLDATVRRQKNVLRLDVAVDDTLGVGRPEAGSHIAGDFHDPLDRHPAFPQAIPEVLPFEKLHDRKGDTILVPEVIDGENVRVGEPGDGAGFSFEAFDLPGIGGGGFAEDLDRDLAFEPGVHGAVDDAHAALAQSVEDLISPEGAPDQCGHGQSYSRNTARDPIILWIGITILPVSPGTHERNSWIPLPAAQDSGVDVVSSAGASAADAGGRPNPSGGGSGSGSSKESAPLFCRRSIFSCFFFCFFSSFCRFSNL